MRVYLVWAPIILMVTAASFVRADPAPAPAQATPATIAMSRQIDFTSEVNGHTYRIQIAIPFAPPPKAGFPVLYVLDGDGYFGTYAFAARMRAMSQEIEPAVVVGIGYPDGQDNFMISMNRRNDDLTQTDAEPEMKALMKSAGIPASEYGHADTFLQVIDTEIKPKVAAAVAVDPKRSILFGHSLGGLFVVHTLFTHPHSFQTYLALSPSIWFANRDVLKDEAAFIALFKAGKIAPRVFIAVGGEEQSPSKFALPPGFTRESEARMMAKAAMVDNVRELGRRLSAIQGAPGSEIRVKVFDGETHISVAWASVNAFLNFALPVASQAGK